jgi:hypothetical protein
MSGEIKILKFAEGTATVSPQQLASYTLQNIYSTATSYVVTDTDNYNLIIASGAGTQITLPNPLNNAGRVITVKRNDAANNIVVLPHSGCVIDEESSITLEMNLMARTFAAVDSTSTAYIII